MPPASSCAGALALIERGELTAAEAMIADAEHEPGERSLELAFMLHALARMGRERGAHREALDRELEAGRILEQELSATVSILGWRTGAERAAHRLGEQQLAEELTQAALQKARALENPVFIGRALHTAGVIARGPASIELLEQATATLERSHAQLEYAHALVDYGRARRRANRRRDARAPLDRGYELASKGGALALAERAALARQFVAAIERCTGVPAAVGASERPAVVDERVRVLELRMRAFKRGGCLLEELDARRAARDHAGGVKRTPDEDWVLQRTGFLESGLCQLFGELL